MIGKLFIFFVRIYQVGISPWIGKNCRFTPTCSQYTIESIKTHGVWTGGKYAIKRISRCHPWGGHGYDPVPPKQKHQ